MRMAHSGTRSDALSLCPQTQRVDGVRVARGGQTCAQEMRVHPEVLAFQSWHCREGCVPWMDGSAHGTARRRAAAAGEGRLRAEETMPAFIKQLHIHRLLAKKS